MTHAEETLTRENDALRASLEVTASMLDYEATCHAESGDAKRLSYVRPLRAQVAAARAVLAIPRLTDITDYPKGA